MSSHGNGLVFRVLLLFALASTSQGNGVTVTVSAKTDTSMTITATSDSAFQVGGLSVVDPPAANVNFSPTSTSTASTTATFEVSGLTAGTSYTIKLTGLTSDGSTALTPVDAPAPATCTKPPPVTALTLDTTRTGETEIVVTWTNPPTSGFGKLIATYDSFDTDITDTSISEFTYEESASGTAIVASVSGTCKVATVITTGGCNNELNRVEIPCASLGTGGSAIDVAVSNVEENSATITATSAVKFKVGGINSSPAQGVSFDQTAITTATTSAVFAATGLSPGIQYTFTLTGLTTAADNDLNPASRDSQPTCTKPAPVTNLAIVSSGETEIAVTWNNPGTVPGELIVGIDAYSVKLNPSDASHTYSYKDAGTPLTAGFSGSCSVTIKIINGNCAGLSNTEEIACSTKDNFVTLEVTDVTDTTATVTATRTSNFKIGAISAASSTGAVFTPPLSNSAVTSATFSVTGLAAGTKQSFTLSGLTDDAPTPAALDPSTEESVMFCTKPEGVSDLAVDSSSTTDTEIKITWTNPDVIGRLVVEFDSRAETLTSSSPSEHVFTLSFDDTPLTAGTDGKCRVTNELVTGPCLGQLNTVEIDCTTTGTKSTAAEPITSLTLLITTSIMLQSL